MDNKSVPPNEYLKQMTEAQKPLPATAIELAQLAAPILAGLWILDGKVDPGAQKPSRRQLLSDAVILAIDLYAVAHSKHAEVISAPGRMALDAMRTKI